MLGELALDAHDITDESGHRGVELPERPARLAQDALRELEARRVGQQVGLRLHADAKAVLAQQPTGVGVVGRDARLAVRIDVERIVVLRQLGAARGAGAAPARRRPCW